MPAVQLCQMPAPWPVVAGRCGCRGRAGCGRRGVRGRVDLSGCGSPMRSTGGCRRGCHCERFRPCSPVALRDMDALCIKEWSKMRSFPEPCSPPRRTSTQNSRSTSKSRTQKTPSWCAADLARRLKSNPVRSRRVGATIPQSKAFRPAMQRGRHRVYRSCRDVGPYQDRACRAGVKGSPATIGPKRKGQQ